MSSREVPFGSELPYPTQFVLEDEVTEGDKEYAWRRLVPVIEKLDEPVQLVRVKLKPPEPTGSPDASAQILVDIRGDLVRAQVGGDTMPEAIDRLKDRLVDQLEHRSRRRAARRERPASSPEGQWRRGDQPTVRPGRFDRPREDRELVSRKTYAIEAITPDEAIFDMEQLDHDFYLFEDLTSGKDALVARENGSYRLRRVGGEGEMPGPSAFSISITDTNPPQLTVSEAIQNLETLETPYLFFVNTETDRANVAYWRYDGHYGLISPE